MEWFLVNGAIDISQVAAHLERSGGDQDLVRTWRRGNHGKLCRPCDTATPAPGLVLSHHCPGLVDLDGLRILAS